MRTEYVPFKKIHHSVEDCENVVKEYIICSREVSEWKPIQPREYKFIITEMCDLFSVSKSKDEINQLISKYNVKCTPKVSPMGQAYSDVSGEYANVVCFLSSLLDMSVVDIMCSIGNERFWCKHGRCN